MSNIVKTFNVSYNRLKLCCVLLLGATLLPIASVDAQQSDESANVLEEVIVTASKIGEVSLQNIPI